MVCLQWMTATALLSAGFKNKIYIMKIEEYFNEGTPFQSMKPALSKTVVMRSLSIFQKKLLTQIIGEKLHICEIMDWTKDHKTTYTITDGENDFFDIKKETFNAIKQFFQYEQLCGSTDLSRRKWTIKIECFPLLVFA